MEYHTTTNPTTPYTEQLKLVNTITQSLADSLELDQLYQQLDQGIYHLLPGTSAVLISYYNGQSETFTFMHASNEEKRADTSDFPVISLGNGPQSEAIRSKQPVIVRDLSERLKSASVKIPIGLPPYPKSALFAPMVKKGFVTGIIQAQSYFPDHYTQDDADILTIIASAAGIIIDNTRLLNETRNQLERLTALRTIDMAINASLDMRVTLNILLEEIISQLHSDAAAILLYNPHIQALDYAAFSGFRANLPTQSQFGSGKGPAARVALERQVVQISPLYNTNDYDIPQQWIRDEGFMTYYGAPLVAKGQLMGVLEVFRRSSFDPDPEWVNFFEILAGQAAIAIDSATLFNELQRSNMELSLAYDTTLEGWSRALDLRDQDTEGHTQRVTEMSMRLAKAMGLSENEILYIRRGALLHDIGKMGVPDNILHKPGPLTAEEEIIMHQHPIYAYEMLSSIDFLTPSLDIPYCHHEKWDGTGYPRGLKGEQIPLAARIFSLVDVWDSLRSDRPYRSAWSLEQVLTHIQDQAGRYFDPTIVEVFLKSEVW